MSGGSGRGLVIVAPDIDSGSGLRTAMTYTCRGETVRAFDTFATARSLLQARVEARL
jgi:hypothetical protein